MTLQRLFYSLSNSCRPQTRFPHPFYSPKSFKDLPLLDHVGSEYRRRDHSFIIGNRIFRSVILFSSDKVYFKSSPLATWLAPDGPTASAQGQFSCASQGNTVTIASQAVSMTVNALVTGLIVFRILKAFFEIKAQSSEHSAQSETRCSASLIICITRKPPMVRFPNDSAIFPYCEDHLFYLLHLLHHHASLYQLSQPFHLPCRTPLKFFFTKPPVTGGGAEVLIIITANNSEPLRGFSIQRTPL